MTTMDIIFEEEVFEDATDIQVVKTWTIGDRVLKLESLNGRDRWSVFQSYGSGVDIMNMKSLTSSELEIGYNWQAWGTRDAEETAQFAETLQEAMAVGAEFQRIYVEETF